MKLHAVRNFGPLRRGCLAYHPTGASLVLATDGKLRVWDWAADKERTLCASIFNDGPLDLCVSPDGRWVLTNGDLWNLATGQLDVQFQCDLNRDWHASQSTAFRKEPPA